MIAGVVLLVVNVGFLAAGLHVIGDRMAAPDPGYPRGTLEERERLRATSAMVRSAEWFRALGWALIVLGLWGFTDLAIELARWLV